MIIVCLQRGQCAVAKKPEKSKSTSVTTNVDESGQLIISTPDEVPQATSISVAADDQDNTSDIKHEEVNVSWMSVVFVLFKCLLFAGRTMCCCKKESPGKQ